MSIVRTLLLFFTVGAGTYWAWNFDPTVRNLLEQTFQSGEFLTVEATYSPERIMEENADLLIGVEEERAFLEPEMQFLPFLLLDVKYSDEKARTQEGRVLWSFVDGEMVLDTESWEMSHGFEDCLTAGASRTDFKVINTLASNNGRLDRSSLIKKLNVEPAMFDEWIESVKDKNLVVQAGNDYRLHFESPRLQVSPSTRISRQLVSKPYKHSQRIDRRYSRSEIERNAKAAFGANFAVRGYREVFLPVYRIEVQNPDGSIASTYWNALNGKQIKSFDLH